MRELGKKLAPRKSEIHQQGRALQIKFSICKYGLLEIPTDRKGQQLWSRLGKMNNKESEELGIFQAQSHKNGSCE